MALENLSTDGSRSALFLSIRWLARRGWQEPPGVTLRREVCAVAAVVEHGSEFFTRLRVPGAERCV
jgi:hypothetical protein